MNVRFVWIVLAVVAAFAVGMVAERWSTGAARASAAERELTKELAGIRALLERIAEQAEGGGGLGQVPEPLLRAPERLVEGLLDQARGGGDGMRAKDPAVDQALRELYDKVKEEGAQTRDLLRANGVVALSELRAAKPTPDHAALSQVEALCRQDASAAQRTLLLSRVEELIARFGVPDHVKAGQFGIQVVYDRPGTDQHWFRVDVKHGLVTRVRLHHE